MLQQYQALKAENARIEKVTYCMNTVSVVYKRENYIGTNVTYIPLLCCC